MFIAMEYVDGELISERVARGPLPVPEALDIAAQVAEALDEAHGRGVTHRDIKSANLIQTRRGLVKVLDFGLAKLDVPSSVEANLLTQPDILVTAPGMVLGTIAYMAPEQLRGDGVDQRVDLWALGVVLYEMLTGTLPFRGNTLAAVFDQILRQEPAPLAQLNPAIPLDVEHVVRRALQKAPVSRYNAASDMHNALRHAARRLETGGSTTGVRPVHVETGERTIAVLTFTNVTGDAADDWIGTGIAETVTADLKNVQHVTVIGRAQVFEQLKYVDRRDRPHRRQPGDRDRPAARGVVGGLGRLSTNRRTDPHHRAARRGPEWHADCARSRSMGASARSSSCRTASSSI